MQKLELVECMLLLEVSGKTFAWSCEVEQLVTVAQVLNSNDFLLVTSIFISFMFVMTPSRVSLSKRSRYHQLHTSFADFFVLEVFHLWFQDFLKLYFKRQ